MRHATLLTAAALLLAGTAFADPYDPPAGYYNSATGTGTTLKNQLHNIIDNHTVLSYDSARFNLQVTDRDPNNSSRILLVYNRVSVPATWDGGNTWNREHTWPRSRGVDQTGADNSDLHTLRPSDPSINTSRSNLNFGGAFGQQGYGIVNDSGTYW